MGEKRSQMAQADDPQTADWEEVLNKRDSIFERVIEWFKQPPYKKRDLRKELAYLKENIQYAEDLPNYDAERQHTLNDLIDLAHHYYKQAENTLEQSDFLGFHRYVSHTDRVLFFFSSPQI